MKRLSQTPPRSPFATRLSGSARETELRIRNIFQWKKKRPPVWLMALIGAIILLCGSLVSCQSQAKPAFPIELQLQYYDQLGNDVEVPALAVPETEDSRAVNEALSALDAATRSQILELLLSIQKKRKIACLFISHDLALIRKISSRISVLYQGRLAETGDTREVCSDPWHPYTRQLLDAVPEADPVRARKIRTSYVQEQDRGEKKDGCGCPFAGRCGYAMDCCFEETPGNYIFGSRMVSCFLYSQEHSGRRGEGYTMTSQI